MTAETLAVATDDGLIHELEQHDPTGLAGALRDRRLAKRALDIAGTDLPAADGVLARDRSRSVAAGGGAAGAPKRAWAQTSCSWTFRRSRGCWT